MTTFLVILVVGLGSFAFRLGPLLLLERVALDDRTDRAIRNGGTAAITALIVVAVRQGATSHATVPMLLAMAAAVVLAVRGATMLRLLLFGGAIYAGAVIAVDLLAR